MEKEENKLTQSAMEHQEFIAKCWKNAGQKIESFAEFKIIAEKFYRQGYTDGFARGQVKTLNQNGTCKR